MVEYHAASRRVRAIDGVNLSMEGGETLGVVGESGSGKSTLGLAIGRLLPPNARKEGEIVIEGESVFSLTNRKIRELRLNRLGFVFQNPMAVLDPTKRVADLLGAVLTHGNRTRDVAALLQDVGLPDIDRVVRSFPHELSGGMAQRVAIAIAIARNPGLVIADEPTAALDATIRAQILELLVSFPRSSGSSLILLSHDLRAVAKYCQRIAVMYGGRIVETGPTSLVLARPSHPYTEALLKAVPGLERPGDWISPIPGVPAVLTQRAHSCSFAPRCGWAIEVCKVDRPEPRRVAERTVVCYRAEEVAGASQ